MAGVRDSLIDLERHKRLLEENVNKLQQALHHWQTWDAEYEALKEDVSDAASATLAAEFERIQRDFEGELITPKELKEIFGPDGLRSRDQVINILDRRVDYVTRNIGTLKKQLQTVENKLAAALVISQPDAEDEDGQPITDIIETLDDDDNVVSFELNRPGQSLSHIQEALKKAGIEDLPELDQDASSADVAGPSKPTKEKSSSSNQSIVSEGKSTQVDSTLKKPTKKGVSFAEDTKSAAPDIDEESQPISMAALRVQNIMDSAKEQEKITEDPIIPEEEDPEDAALRQEMLQYSMGEVGAVVAELQLEEDNADTDDYGFEYTDDEFDDDDDDDEYGEDSHGRYTGRVVTDDYRARMLELEQKLGVKSRFTVKEQEKQANRGVDDSGSDDERIGRIVVNQQAAPSATTETALPQNEKGGKEKKKGVRFADNLDVASESTITDPKPPAKNPETIVEPLSDIVERSPASKPTESKPSGRTSRFKSARKEPTPAAQPARHPTEIPIPFQAQERPIAPTGPDGKTIADMLVERETVPSPIPDDEYDDSMTHSDVAVEHQRLRRKFVNSQGGFLKEDESPIQATHLSEGRERQSRFKAARHSNQ